MMTMTDENNGGQTETIAKDKQESRFRITLEPVMLIFVLIKVSSDPVLTEVILKRTCQSLLRYNDTICDALGTNTTQGRESEALVQPAASSYLLYNQLLGSIIPTIISLFLGPWTDVNGRKPVVVSPLVGCCIMYATYTVLSLINDVHPAYYLIGVIPFAISGGATNLATAVYCYTSDISSFETKVFRLGILEGCFQAGTLLGFILGPRLFAIAEKSNHGDLAVFGSSTILMVILLIYVIVHVQESVDVNRTSKEKRRLLQIQHIKDMWTTFIRKRPKGQRTTIYLSICIISVSTVILNGEAQIAFLFTRLQFGWSLEEFTNFASVIMAIIIVGTIFCSWVVPHFLKNSEVLLGLICLIMCVVQNIFVLFTGTGQVYVYYIGNAFRLLQGALAPAVNAVLTKTVPMEEIGKVFALAAFTDAISSLTMAPLYVTIYKTFIRDFPPSPYALSALLNFVMVIAIGVILHTQRAAAAEQKRNLTNGGENALKMK